MACPNLTAVTMVFCSASPVRKYLEASKLTTESPCSGTQYLQCPLYREAAQAAEQEIRDFEAEGCPLAATAGVKEHP
jgi:hypothetical protein